MIHALAPVRTVGPTTTPITVAEAKSHLRVDHTDEDTLIGVYVDAVTASLDGWAGTMGRPLVTQTWRQDFDMWPCGELRLPFPAVQSVTSVLYSDSANAEQTLAAGNYALIEDVRSSVLRWTPSAVLPTVYDRADAIRVTFVAGYGAAAAVPAAIKAGMLLMVADLYENRETVVIGQTIAETPAVDNLLTPYRRRRG